MRGKLEKRSKVSLLELARGYDLEVDDGMNKAQLINLILETKAGS